MRFSIVSTVRTGAAELLQFLNYYHNTGLDAVYLFFDDPADELIQSRALLPDNVVATVCDSEYWAATGSPRPFSIEQRQVTNANRALEAARTAGIEWIAHVDSDELIYTTAGLPLVFSELAAETEVVRMSLREAVCAEVDAKDIFSGVSLFKRPTAEVRLTNTLAEPAIEDALFQGEYLRAHTASKCFARINPNLLSLRIHGAERRGKGEIATDQVKLLHYDCTTLAAWKAKWGRRLDNTGAALHMRPNRRAQLEYYRQSSTDERALIAAFKRLHCLCDQTAQQLVDLGFAERISIPAELFETAVKP